MTSLDYESPLPRTHRNPLVRAYLLVCRWAGTVVLSLLLLLMRIIWGWQFHVTGVGKLHNIPKVTGFFTDLHIPMPGVNAWVVAIVEAVGGLLLLAGLGGRVTGIILTINMTVAYLTAHREKNLLPLFKDGDASAFSSADPFWFLVTSVLVVALGPGMFSIDAFLKRYVFQTRKELPQ